MDINIALTLGGVMAILVGAALGYLLRWFVAMSKKGSVELEVKQVLLYAKEEAQKIIEEADRRAEVYGRELHEEEREQSERFKKIEERLIKKEEFLDKRQTDIDSEVSHIKEKADELRVIREKTNKENEFVHKELERVARLNTEDAKEELVKRVEKTYQEDLLARIKKLEADGEERLAQKARDILATSIQRLATSTAAEMMVTSVPIASDEIKGKIIGKEGRNIRAFERAAGVEVIVDDTPGSILISSFDP